MKASLSGSYGERHPTKTCPGCRAETSIYAWTRSCEIGYECDDSEWFAALKEQDEYARWLAFKNWDLPDELLVQNMFPADESDVNQDAGF